MTSQEHGSPTDATDSGSVSWDPSEWEIVRNDPDEAPAMVASPAPAETPSQPDPKPEIVSAPAIEDAPAAPAPPPEAQFDLDLSMDPQAQDFVARNQINTVENAFTLANILHTNRHVREAAQAYQIAINLHSRSPHQHPTVQVLLQVRLLCILKSGSQLPLNELDDLRNLNRPYANYIEGIVTSWRDRDHQAALRKIGSAYDEFHTGEEIDSLTLEIVRYIEPSLFEKPASEQDTRRIPRNLFMYWDQNPPEEIRRNFEYHRQLSGFNVKIFDREEAILWLYTNYGVEARNIFTNLRHPAEAADFLRVHVTQLLGGWWLDADLRLRSPEVLDILASQTAQNVFFVTSNHVVHNDFYGTIPNSAVIADCMLSIYRNCYLFHNLFIAYKTGPGPFMRALNRTAYRSFNGNPPVETTKIYNQSDFNELIEEFDTPYKQILPNWQQV